MIAGGWRVYGHDSLRDESVLRSIGKFAVSGDAPDDWVRMDSSRNATAWRFRCNDKWYLFKKYLERGAFENVKSIFAGTRAKKAWINGNILSEHGFLTPRLYVLGEKGSRFFPSGNFLVSEFLTDVSASFVFLRDRFRPPLTSRELDRKRAFLRALGHLIGRMHGKGIFHGDLRPGNILVEDQEGNPRFYFIDNERNRYFPRGIPDRYRLKNLVQINMIVYPPVTFTDRLRFFQGYLEENPQMASSAKHWMRRAFFRTKQRLRKTFPGIWGATR